MTAIDERAELKRIAAEAIAEINKLVAEVSACRKRLDVVVNHLLSDADTLALAAADERSEGVTTRAVRMGKVLHEAVEKVLVPKTKVVLNAAAALAEADAVKKVKRKRGPVSPERKAQLVETLKKARAARAKKGTDGN